MPQTASGTIPMRSFGRHSEVKISALGFGGHHLGEAPDAKTADKVGRERHHFPTTKELPI